MLVRVSYHARHARQRSDLLGNTLRVAARDDDLCIRILPPRPSDRRPRILIGGRCYGAGIQHHQRGLVWR